MKKLLTEQYDSLYAATGASAFGGGSVVPAVLRLPAYQTEGTVLDIGGGDGRHALALAKLGYDVTVVDLSTVGLQKLQATAQAEQLSIKTYTVDVITEGIVGEYNAMVCTFVLHHMAEEAIPGLIENMQAHTVSGGVHIIATFLNQGGLYDRNQKSGSGRYYPALEALRAHYTEWEILECFSRETTSLAKDKTGTPLKNAMGVLVACKRV